MHLERFLYTPFGRLLMSILLGFGLASMMRKVCKDQKCYRFHAPDHEKDIQGKTFQYNGECYQFELEAVQRNPQKTLIQMKQPIV